MPVTNGSSKRRSARKLGSTVIDAMRTARVNSRAA